MISCAVAFGPVATTDHCGDWDPNARAKFDIPLNEGLTGMVIRITDEPTWPNQPYLRLKFSQPVTISGPSYHVRGYAPVEQYFDLSEHQWAQGELPQVGNFGVRPIVDPAVGAVSFVYQYEFNVEIQLLYHGAEPSTS